MARFHLKQKYFAIRDGFYVKDDHGNDVFFVQGKIFTLAKKLYLYDTNGQEIYLVKGRLFRLFPRYDIMRGEELVAKIKRTLPIVLFKRYKVTSEKFGNFVVRSGAFAFHFNVFQDGQKVCEISKKILKIADTYTVDVQNPRMAPFMIAIALMIDARHHRRH